MRKLYFILILVLVFSFLCSCGNAELSSSSPSAGSPEAESASPSDIAGQNNSPSPSPSKTIPVVDNDARFDLFRSFLSDNYQGLSDAFLGGISGIGFIDLDIDGGVEMLVFDAGASAAMGLQFFDIIDDKVECVSANMDSVGKAFGGEHMSKIEVNANHFDDFRLMQNKETGNKFFIVQSGNGAADFIYSELIRFGSNNGVLTLESLMYKYDEYDVDNGNLINESFKIAGKDTDKAKYDAANSAFFSENEDLGYVAMGALLWEGDGYGTGKDGLLKMADKARTLYYANSYLIT